MGSRQPRGLGRFWVEGGVGLLGLAEGVDGVSHCLGWAPKVSRQTCWFGGGLRTLGPTRVGLSPLGGPLKASEPAQAGAPPGRVVGAYREAWSMPWGLREQAASQSRVRPSGTGRGWGDVSSMGDSGGKTTKGTLFSRRQRQPGAHTCRGSSGAGQQMQSAGLGGGTSCNPWQGEGAAPQAFGPRGASGGG